MIVDRTEIPSSGADLGRSARPASGWQPSLMAIAAVLATIHVAVLATLTYDRAITLFQDDAFYYFGIARNLASGAGSTFNRLDATNGYHPLWQMVLVPVFTLTSNRGALVGVAVVSAALFVVSARLLDRLGQLAGRPLLFTIGAAPLVVLGLCGPAFWFSGMETGLLLLLLLAVAVVFIRSDGLLAPWFGVRHAAGLGLLIGLVVLARLDAAFPMLLFGAVAVSTWRRTGKLLRLTVALAAPSALLLSGYLAVNQLIFHTSLPVSGQAKALGGGALTLDVLEQFLAAPRLFGQQIWLGALAVIAVPAAVTIAKRGTGLEYAAQFALVVLVGGLVTAIYYTLTSSWVLWPWYFYAAPLALALATPALLDRLPATWPWPVITAIACVSAVVLVSANSIRLITGEVTRSAFVRWGPEVAARLDELAPQQGAVAMGDRAGSVGFHSRRPLVHLEGLVNSAGYLDALRTGRVAEFLAARDVRFYIRADSERGAPAGPGCWSFREPEQGNGPKVSLVVCDVDLVLRLPLPDGTAFRMWHYRPA
jgi:hypothetical protein